MGFDAYGEDDAGRLSALGRYAVLDTPPEPAFDRITALAADLLDAPLALISLVAADRVWFKSVFGPLDLRELPRARAPCAAAIETVLGGEATCLLDGAWMREHPPLDDGRRLVFYAGVPLESDDGHRIGMLCCLDVRPRRLTPRQHRHLGLLAAVVMDEMELRRSAMQLSRLSEALAGACNDLERRASYDPLTGVLSRGAMLERAARLVERAGTGGKGAAVLLVDIDHFKRVNDTHGHAAGDRVLREVADRMAASCRGDDLLGRVGGEEFLAIFADVSGDEAVAIAERFRAAVARRPITVTPGREIAVSISGGLRPVAAGVPAPDLPAAMAEADAALYRAKSAGRNRIVLAEDAPAADADPLTTRRRRTR